MTGTSFNIFLVTIDNCAGLVNISGGNLNRQIPVGNYLSGMRMMMALLGLDIPDVKDKQMQMFLIGLKRVMQHTVKQASPITPQILARMSKVVNYRDKVEVIAWTATLLGFYMFLQKSNLVPDAMDKFERDTTLYKSRCQLVRVGQGHDV